jgi:hypothetical protein
MADPAISLMRSTHQMAVDGANGKPITDQAKNMASLE